MRVVNINEQVCVGGGNAMHRIPRLADDSAANGFGSGWGGFGLTGVGDHWSGGGASGDWREPSPALDGAISATAGRAAGAAATAFVEGALIGAGYGRFAGPMGILGGLVVGGVVGVATHEFLKTR